MKVVQDIATLEALYGAPVPVSLTISCAGSHPPKVAALQHRGWPWCPLSEPRGRIEVRAVTSGPLVRIMDAQTLLLPDCQGKN